MNFLSGTCNVPHVMTLLTSTRALQIFMPMMQIYMVASNRAADPRGVRVALPDDPSRGRSAARTEAAL